MKNNICFETWLSICQLIQSYSEVIDKREADKLANLFTEEGILDISPNQRVIGSKAIADGARKMFSQEVKTSHHIGQPNIRHGVELNQYIATTYTMVVNRPKIGSGYTMYGHYVDEIIKQEDLFLIQKRKIVAHLLDGEQLNRHWLHQNS